MNIQPNAYEINKAYRQTQEVRSETLRRAEEIKAKPEKIIPPSLVQLFSSIVK
jgi:hypothetical protein